MLSAIWMRYCLFLTRGIQRCVNMHVHRNASCFGWWRMDSVLAFFFFFLFLSGLTVSCLCAHRFLFSLYYQCSMFPARQKRADSFFINSSQWKRQTCECTRGSHLCFRPPPRPLFHPLGPPAKTKSNILLFIQLNWKWRFFFPHQWCSYCKWWLVQKI